MNSTTRRKTSRANGDASMGVPLSTATLQTENLRFAGTSGVSQRSRGYGFLPAFLDSRTGEVYLSRFADGRPAPIHMLDGLPSELVIARNGRRATAVKASIVSGFVRDHRFYTREQAALAANPKSAVDRRAAIVSH